MNKTIRTSILIIAMACALSACTEPDVDQAADAAPAGPDAADSLICGDDVCESPETCSSCEADCGTCESDPFCGDDVCESPETCSSCEADCGACACSASDPDSCSGEDICIDSDCVAAFGRTYTLSVSSLTISDMSPSGDDWDAFMGLPDPFVVVTLNGETALETERQMNTLTPEPYDTGDYVIPAAAELAMEALDGDATNHDHIVGCGLAELTAAHLRDLNAGLVLLCDEGMGSTLAIGIVPR